MVRARFVLSGILAAVAGIAAGHLVAGFTGPASSPVLTIGSTVIDLTPTPVKEWAVAHFGTNDKPILLGSVVLVTLVAAGLVGLVARRHRGLALGLIGLLVVVPAGAALARPAFAPLDVVPAAVTLLVGLGSFWWLTGLASAVDPDHEHGVAHRDRATSARREFLGGALGIAVLSALAAAGGQLRAGAQAGRRLVLPRPADRAPAFPVGLEREV